MAEHDDARAKLESEREGIGRQVAVLRYNAALLALTLALAALLEG